MRVAIASDIHGNRQAFEAVIGAAQEAQVEELWCLGDLVGYGADPDACVALAEANCAICLAGNHDLAVVESLSLEDFSRGAALAAQWTIDVIRPETREFLLGLAAEGEAEGIGLYHASPRDPIWEYVLSGLTAELCLDAAPQRVSLIGHSHVALSFHRPEGEPASGSHPPRGRPARHRGGRVAAQPGLDRPAAGRRPARRVADPRHGGMDRRVAPLGLRPRGRPGRDPRGAAAGLARRAPPIRPVTKRTAAAGGVSSLGWR